MNRNITIVLIVFAIGYFGILAGVTINNNSLPETIGNTYIITLEETLTISDSVEVPVNYEYIFDEETLRISDKIEVSLNG